MNKINYDLIMQNTIKNFNGKKPSLLLHSCCAPCSSSVIERIKDFFSITVFYYNPNIFPEQEYIIRKEEQIKYLKSIGIPYIEGDYDKNSFYNAIEGLECEKEGGKRCYACYNFRMEKTAIKGKELNFDYFCTTLSVSPHKNSQYVNDIGSMLQEKYNIKFLHSDFKKRQGFLRSTQLSKENNFYRQNYCGCEYGIRKEEF